MYTNWWAFSSIKKPCEDDEKKEGIDHWTMATHIMDNLQGEFLVFV
jgi:hypothetical protein